MMKDIISEYREVLYNFYLPYFSSDYDLNEFLYDTYDYEKGSIEVRQMIFQIQRFVSMANDIDKIRPGRQPLRIMILRIGLESLCSLAGLQKNKKSFFDIFCKCFTNEGETYILNNFKLVDFEDEYKGHIFSTSHNIDLTDFLNIMKVTRDSVVHDGIFWEMQFFSDYYDDVINVASMETDENLLVSYKYHRSKKIKTTYIFETTMKYEKFIFYYVQACVNFIKRYKIGLA